MKPQFSFHAKELRLTVNEVVQRYRLTLATFKTLHIDACCNGNLTLETAIARERPR